MFKRKRLIIVCAVIVAVAAALTFYVKRHYAVPILMYHAIAPNADENNRLAVSPWVFARQMRFLAQYHYNVIPLEKLAQLIQSGAKIPSRTVVITFDDGYGDTFQYVYPVILKYRLPVEMNIIVNEVGRPPVGDRLTWDQIRIMQRSGLVSIGSHTLGPGLLTECANDAEVKRQLTESKRVIEEKIGAPVNIFSYPEGRFNAKIRQDVIDAGYTVAVATHPGLHYPNNDVFALKRLRISENSGNMFVFWFETSGIYTFIRDCSKHNKQKRAP